MNKTSAGCRNKRNATMLIHGSSKTRISRFNSTLMFFGFVFMLGLVGWLMFSFKTPGFFKIVMGVFSLFIIANAYQAFRNSIFSKKALPHTVSNHDLKVKIQSTKNNHGHSERLRQIEKLYRDGLLSLEEYQAKRKDVLDEDWGR
ncbi:MAG: SHOCT domain-containing protein [Gammaproteobacteria bacterium]|nr:SHOCT domain-containing protein [Gammaproteobacteria bacterium]